MTSIHVGSLGRRRPKTGDLLRRKGTKVHDLNEVPWLHFLHWMFYNAWLHQDQKQQIGLAQKALHHMMLRTHCIV